MRRHLRGGRDQEGGTEGGGPRSLEGEDGRRFVGSNVNRQAYESVGTKGRSRGSREVCKEL
eukprot:3534934-Prorocentrum_lima.AAC.1